MTINWNGKGNYIQCGQVIRRAAGTELMNWYCTSIQEVKRTFGVQWAEVMDWTTL